MVFTESQKQCVNEVFCSFSGSKKRKSIPREKIREVLSTLGITVTDAEVFEMCKAIGITKNARVEIMQFMEQLDKMIDAVQKQDEYEAVFDLFDRNNDSFITAPDLRAVLYDFGVSSVDVDLEALMNATESQAENRRLDKAQFITFIKAVMSGQRVDSKKPGTPLFPPRSPGNKPSLGSEGTTDSSRSSASSTGGSSGFFTRGPSNVGTDRRDDKKKKEYETIGKRKD